jgi:hypothetical protein
MEPSPKDMTKLLKTLLSPVEWQQYAVAISELREEAQELDRWFNGRLQNLVKEQMLERLKRQEGVTQKHV